MTLPDLQRPVAEALDTVTAEIARMIAADVPLMQEVNRHLLHMKGKLFRPTLLLLTDEACGTGDPRAVNEISAMYGDPDDIAKKLEALREAGAGYVLINGGGSGGGARSRESLRRFARDVMPAFVGE